MLISELQQLFGALSRNEKKLLKYRFEVTTAPKAIMLFNHLNNVGSIILNDSEVCKSIYNKAGGSEYSHLKEYMYKSILAVSIGTRLVTDNFSRKPDYSSSMQHIVSKELVERGFYQMGYNALAKCLAESTLDQLSEEMKILILTRTIRSFGNQFLNLHQLSMYKELLRVAINDMKLIAEYSSTYKVMVNDESFSIAQTYGMLMRENKVELYDVKEEDISISAINDHTSKTLKSTLCKIAILWYKSIGDFEQVAQIMDLYESIQSDQKGNENEIGGLKFAMGLNCMMLLQFEKAEQSFTMALELMSHSNEKSFHAAYFLFLCSVIQRDKAKVKLHCDSLSNWRLDQSSKKSKYYSDWKKLAVAIKHYYICEYDKSFSELQGLSELYADRFGWRMTIKYLEILCLLRLGDYDNYMYKYDSFRKYFYLIRDSDFSFDKGRIEEFYRFLGEIGFANGNFYVNKKYVYERQSIEWNPIGWEVFKLSKEHLFLKKH